MNYILFDGTVRKSLLPLTYTRPVADLRIGILTIREKWEHHLDSTTTTITEDYLEDKYPMVEMKENIMINASFLPTNELIEIIKGTDGAPKTAKIEMKNKDGTTKEIVVPLDHLRW